MTAEPDFITAYGAGLTASRPQADAVGRRLHQRRDEIGAATAIEFGPGGLMTAVSEPERRGGGSARVVDPR